MKRLRKQFEEEKGYPSWNCNDTVIQEYVEWLEDKLNTKSEQPEISEDRLMTLLRLFNEWYDEDCDVRDLEKWELAGHVYESAPKAFMMSEKYNEWLNERIVK